jgi:hypothetical protein
MLIPVAGNHKVSDLWTESTSNMAHQRYVFECQQAFVGTVHALSTATGQYQPLNLFVFLHMRQCSHRFMASQWYTWPLYHHRKSACPAEFC